MTASLETLVIAAYVFATTFRIRADADREIDIVFVTRRRAVVDQLPRATRKIDARPAVQPVPLARIADDGDRPLETQLGECHDAHRSNEIPLSRAARRSLLLPCAEDKRRGPLP